MDDWPYDDWLQVRSISFSFFSLSTPPLPRQFLPQSPLFLGPQNYSLFSRGKATPRGLVFRGGRACGGGLPIARNEEKGVLAKRVYGESSVMPKETQKKLRILGTAVHLALRAPQPREVYIFAKPPSKNPLSWFLNMIERKRISLSAWRAKKSVYNSRI